MGKYRSCRTIYSEVKLPVWDDSVQEEGTFCWNKQEYESKVYRVIWILMPYSMHPKVLSWHCLRVYLQHEPRPPRPSWLWDGNLHVPTLSPSIKCGPKEQEYWHGYLTAGVLISC